MLFAGTYARRAPVAALLPIAGLFLSVPVIVATPFPASAQTETQSAPQQYAHGTVFTVPQGWRLDNQADGKVVLTAPNLSSGQTAQIIISAMDKPYPSVRESLAADIAGATKSVNGFRTEGELEELTHPGGHPMARQAVSWSSGTFSSDEDSVSPFGRTQAIVYHLDGGKELPWQPVMLVTSSKKLQEAHRATFDAFVQNLRLTTRVELAPAKDDQPALSLHTARRFDSTLEWLLEMQFTPAQQETIHRHLISAWEKGDKDEISGVTETVGIIAQVDAMPAEERPLFRQILRSEALKGWRKDARAGDAGAKALLDMYYAAHQPLAPSVKGAPPLTPEVAESMLNTLYFMASAVADPNGAEVAPPQALRDQWKQGIVAQWKTMSAADKEELCTLPGLGATLRLGWQKATAKDKAQGIAQWSKMPPVKLIAQQIKADRVKAASAAAKRRNDDSGKAIRQVNLYNQLRAYGALRIDHSYIKW